MNNFRNDIAKGHKYDRFLPSASNMRKMVWNYDLEYYMKLLVSAGFRACENDELLRTGWQSSYYGLNGVYTHKIAFNYAMDVIFGMTINFNQNKIAWSLSTNFIANNTQIGCGFGTYVDGLGNKAMFMRCATGERSVSNLKDAYLLGSPCTDCQHWGTECSVNYTGLCL